MHTTPQAPDEDIPDTSGVDGRIRGSCWLLRLRVRQLRRSLRRVETQSVLFEGAGESDALRSDMDHGLRTKSAPHHTSSP